MPITNGSGQDTKNVNGLVNDSESIRAAENDLDQSSYQTSTQYPDDSEVDESTNVTTVIEESKKKTIRSLSSPTDGFNIIIKEEEGKQATPAVDIPKEDPDPDDPPSAQGLMYRIVSVHAFNVLTHPVLKWVIIASLLVFIITFSVFATTIEPTDITGVMH